MSKTKHNGYFERLCEAADKSKGRMRVGIKLTPKRKLKLVLLRRSGDKYPQVCAANFDPENPTPAVERVTKQWNGLYPREKHE